MKIKNFFNKIQQSKGFTLIETMVAITILLTTIVGPMEIASQSLFSAFYSRDQITAYYLAQEGIEYIRNSRDNYYLDSANSGNTNWPTAFSDCVYDGTYSFGCRIDFNTGIIKNDSLENASTTLNYDSTSGTYSYADGGSPSKYTRIVTISPDPSTNPDHILVSSTVSWSGSYFSGETKSFTIKETLYNWQTE